MPSCAIRFLQAEKKREEWDRRGKSKREEFNSIAFFSSHPIFLWIQTKDHKESHFAWIEMARLPARFGPSGRRSREGERRHSAPPAMTERAKLKKAKKGA
ncbi:hypothetical protein Acr_13g0000970 [Actinidia rufa]|uniref:Uncharacterized protein n=1 Tax=Actinidia rufa TaxID=165716 RepID=A0A7J0FJT8_9ERIC|nr:hypothetical protein Acr_13g0000970 [Actinidia rufa]